MKNRIIDYREVRSGDLVPHPLNWRRHPAHQRSALLAMLADIGHADAIVTRETPEGLMILDGHLRADLDENEMIPVLVTDLDEAEAKRFLATHDALGVLAEWDTDILRGLLDEIELAPALEIDLFPDLMSGEAPQREDTNEAWQEQQPGWEQNHSQWKSINVHFKDQDAVNDFNKRLGLNVNESTKYVLWPPGEEQVTADQYQVEDDPSAAG